VTPERILAIRSATGLSPGEFAEYMGLSSIDGRYVRAIESGARRPSSVVVRILELIEAGEMPARYLPAVRRRGRPPKVVEVAA
jgi:DNA-binding transcriptional regulator YiaG